MAHEVKIIWFGNKDEDTQRAEVEIAQLLDKGWVIAGAGGAGAGGDMAQSLEGFVVMVKG
ncbi:MAG: hypothetical protein JW910_09730 [Anaerolineae bacterium]|nr:hypothetical protein [Anaerolineae bacterium]